MAINAVLGTAGLLLSFQAFAAGPLLPWPGQNPGYNGPAPAAPAAPAQSVLVQPAPPPSLPLPPNTNPQDPSQQALEQMLNLLTGGHNGKGKLFDDEYGGADLLNGYSTDRGFKKSVSGNGNMEPCTMPPPRALGAFKEAMKFRATCADAQRGADQRIVINDFAITGQDEMPYMYIFAQDGTCIGKTAVTYGNGLGRNTFPKACSDPGCHLTPPGFHLTAFHDSATYPSSTSLTLVSLEGQGSGDRGILIHPAAQPGTASSFGCAGVGPLKEVKRTLGEGALVYNYFGDDTLAGGCRSRAGTNHSHGCHLESPQRSIPPTATGVGTPTTSTK